MWHNPKPCAQCGKPLGRRNLTAKYCFPCTYVRAKESMRRSRQRNTPNRSKWALKAHGAVARAIKKGALAPPRTYMCTDCNWRQAQCYDHRDYNKPLDVDPVCWSCNSKRGAAIPHIDDVSSKAA